MTWSRFDDEMLDHPKIIEAGGPGFALNAAAIIWCGRNLTDGFVPARQVPRLIDLSEFRISLAVILDRLTKGTHGPLWEWDEARNGYIVHDYLDYNPSRADVEREREKARIRQGRCRTSRRESRRDTPSDTTRDDSVTHEAVTDAPGPVPGSPGDSIAASESETVAREEEDQDVGRSGSPTGWDRDLTPDLEAELQQRFVDAFLRDPAGEWGAFTTWYRNHPPGPDANWSVLADAWLKGIADKGEAADRPQRRGPRAVHELLAGVGRPLDDPEALRKAELGRQGQRLRAMERG